MVLKYFQKFASCEASHIESIFVKETEKQEAIDKWF